MITQRTCSGGASKAAAIAGKAMLTIESSDTTNAPAAAISRPISPLGSAGDRPHLARPRPISPLGSAGDRPHLARPSHAAYDDMGLLSARHPRYKLPMEIEAGATAEVGYTVAEEQTAHAMGNRGVHVFATPFVVGLLENAAGAVLQPHLPAVAGTVGTMVEMKHLAATPVGMMVRAKATLLETDGRRFLFAVEAWDEKEKIAEGRHERFVVSDMAKFLGRALKKAGG